MEIVKIVGLGLVAGTLAILLRQEKPVFATLLSLAAGALILFLVLERVAGIADVAGQVLRDAGESSIASKVELGGKIIIVVLAIPIVAAILQTLTSMLG